MRLALLLSACVSNCFTSLQRNCLGEFMFYLTANNGPAAGQRYDLTDSRYIMGRHPDCDIVIEVGAVSRNHCQVVRDGNAYFLEDMGSRNGTFLNDEPNKIEGRRQLRHGDQVRVCEVTFTFAVEAPAAPLLQSTTLGGMIEGAGLGTLLVDDDSKSGGGTIMSKLDVSSTSRGSLHVSASPEVKLAALVEITQSLGRALVLDEVLPNLLKALFKIFVQADRGFIVLESPEGQLLPRWVRMRREDANDSLRISKTIIRHVMQSREAILSADAASDERFEMSQSIADFRIRSMMCAPLIDSEGNAMGALQIDTLDQRKRFQPDDLELLASMASQASIAIQNAQLLESALKQREVERDMKLAQDVQQGFLPDRKPDLPGYDFFDYYKAAEAIGGDYFDYITLPDGRLAVVVADVVGHGVAAALLMAKLSAETRYSLYSETTAAAAMTRLNQRISALNIQRFVTMVLVILDPKEHTLTVSNAGHMAPLVRKKNGAISEPGETISGLPLGITDAVDYDQAEFSLDLGETVTLYTDGINEAIAADGSFFTIDRMRQHLTRAAEKPVAIGQRMVDDVWQHLGKAPQNDDMCLVCFGRMR